MRDRSRDVGLGLVRGLGLCRQGGLEWEGVEGAGGLRVGDGIRGREGGSCMVELRWGWSMQVRWVVG